ncbi:sensor histidine kinase [Trichloromonas sp.]|uniref:sensor histidine kinase n=1 Tax=Trichloromonas sp. TaxID=3069249 RepID=UPI003D815DB7
MSKLNNPKKILLAEFIGFAIINLFLWADEIYDLPHHLLGAEATPVNSLESLFETIIIILLGLVVMAVTATLARRLQRADTEKARLFGVISHDLRSPFTNLIGNAELLRKNFTTLSDEERRALSSGIFEAADKAHDLLENLLHWSQLQLEKSVPPPQSCDFHALVERCIDHVGLAATLKQVIITNGVPAGSFVSIDETAVRSVVRNLLSNAVKYSRPGGVIEVTAKGRGGKLRVSVADRGVGMSRKELKGLFHMGTRLSKPGTAGEVGSGLGLLLSHELVRRGGGKLKVRSESGKGSTFSFVLPKARGPKPVAKAPVPSEEAPQGDSQD